MNEDKLEKRFQMVGGIKNVTGGRGGEVFLVMGSEKTAVIDAGMAFSANVMIEKLEGELGGRPLDYVILTHTHYDHVAGLPYLRKRWPQLVAIGSEYGQKILGKPSAQKVIQELSEEAWRNYRDASGGPVLMEGLGIDRTVKEGDRISLGDKTLLTVETPGHTSCSISFFMEPEQLILHNETMGVYTKNGSMISVILKSYKNTMESIEKCKNLGAKYIISPHYGQVPEEEVAGYWQKAKDAANRIKDLVLELKEKGYEPEKILEEYTKRLWEDPIKNQQPKAAFLVNARNVIRVVLQEFAGNEQ